MSLHFDQKLGFGLMRLPMIGDAVDLEQTKKMVDIFLTNGFCYFDTAHGYISGQSEKAVRECLTSRYPRESYILTDKLSKHYFNCEADIRPFFESQLEICGVDYFDFYLMHAQSREYFEHFKRCRAYETAFQLKKEGKVKHVGLSFHDTADVLDRILTEYPQIEVVQLQFNYLDYESPTVQSRLCYEVCQKHGKFVIVMEPVRGGRLVKDLPEEAADIIKGLGITPANLALRYTTSFENVIMVLSGMSALAQMEENIALMKSPVPLSAEEYEATGKVATLLRAKKFMSCTACRYCVDGCPKNISIPDLFSCTGAKLYFKDETAKQKYHDVHTANGHGKASDCIRCGKCEEICPQKLRIRGMLQEVIAEFEEA